MEAEAPRFDRERILELLTRAETFEQFLQSRYLGTKRFSHRRGRGAAPAARRDARGRRRAPRRAGGHRDEPPRPAERHGAHRRPRPGRDLRRLRGRRSAQHPGRRRRQVPHGRDRRLHAAATATRSTSTWSRTRATWRRSIPVALGRVRAKQVRLRRRAEPRPGVPDRPPRRRRLRRPGGPRRDAEHGRPPRLRGGRHGARHRQQPDRLHHRAQGPPLLALRLGRGAAAAGADLPRQRRGPGRRGAGGAARGRLPLRLQERRGGGPDRLPPARPQRGGRPDDHPAAALQEDPGPPAALEALRPAPSASPRRRRSAGSEAIRAELDAAHKAAAALEQEADAAHPAGLLGPLPGGLVASPSTRCGPASRPARSPS